MNDSSIVEAELNNRIKWIDVLKGIGIITVVWGHSGHPYAYLMFLFHMPLFLFISGYLYKPRDGESWLKYTVKKSKHLLVPYIFYLTFFTVILLLFSVLISQPFTATDWKALILGGSSLEGVYGTFWFVTCLFFVQILYDLLQRIVRLKWLKIVILVGCYLLAYWESRYYQEIFLPWNIDVTLFAIIFYSLGNLFKARKWLEASSATRILIIISAIFIVLFFYAYFNHFIRFGLDLKHRQYYFFGSNIIVPLGVIILLCGLSIKLSNWKFVRRLTSSLGESSMSILYLHLFSVSVVAQFIAITPLRFLAIGIVLPWVWYKFASFIPGLSLIALGVPVNYLKK